MGGSGSGNQGNNSTGNFGVTAPKNPEKHSSDGIREASGTQGSVAYFSDGLTGAKPGPLGLTGDPKEWRSLQGRLDRGFANMPTTEQSSAPSSSKPSRSSRRNSRHSSRHGTGTSSQSTHSHSSRHSHGSSHHSGTPANPQFPVQGQTPQHNFQQPYNPPVQPPPFVGDQNQTAAYPNTQAQQPYPPMTTPGPVPPPQGFPPQQQQQQDDPYAPTDDTMPATGGGQTFHHSRIAPSMWNSKDPFPTEEETVQFEEYYPGDNGGRGGGGADGYTGP